MRRAFSLFLAFLLLLPGVASAFSDIDASAYRSDILALKEAGILGGYADGTFKPKQLVNRAELMKIAVGDGPSVVKPSRRCFPDVSVSAWYAPYVCEAKQRRIAKGYPGGGFKPEANVNFAEALAMLLRANKIAVPDGSVPWYEPYVEFAHEHGIVSKNSYQPWDPVSRERVAQIMNGIRRYEKNKDSGMAQGFLSSGCGKAEPGRAPTSVDVNGTLRSFILDVPKNYSSRTPSKIIFAFHGRTNSNEQVRQYFELTKYASDYIVVYPAALKNGSSFAWKASDDGDYAFFDRLLASLGEQYCIDTDEVYIVGHSLGAWFGNSLACARGDVIRGSATLGGDTTMADCTGPVASIVIHNPNDQQAPFSGGVKARDLHLTQNSCEADKTVPAEPSEFKCVKYTSCTDGHPMLWCPHEQNISSWDNQYYPHQWPRNTGKYIVDFFRSLESL